MSSSAASLDTTERETMDDGSLVVDTSWLTWPKEGPPIAAKDIPEGTLLFTEEPLACAASIMLAEDHPARAMYPEHTRFLPTETSSEPFTVYSELASALEERGIDHRNVREHLPVDADIEKEHNVMASAVLLNHVAMTCSFVGTVYGAAICEKISRMPHECLSDTDVLFGKGGLAHVFTTRAVSAGASPSINFSQQHNMKAMCPCLRKEVGRRINKLPCACASCASTTDCHEHRCLKTTAFLMSAHSADIQKLVFSPLDYLSLHENAEKTVEMFTQFMGKHPEILSEQSYITSRLAIMFFMMSSGVEKSMQAYKESLAKLEAACALFENTPTPTMIRPKALGFAKEMHTMEHTQKHKTVLMHAESITWVHQVSVLHPWMQDAVLDFCVLPRMVADGLFSFIEGAWTSRDIDQARVEAHAAAVTAVASSQSARTDASASALEKICNTCASLASFRCARCKTTRYCSRTCQKKDWLRHSGKECRPLLSPVLGTEDDTTAWEKWPLKERAIASVVRESEQAPFKQLQARHDDENTEFSASGLDFVPLPTDSATRTLSNAMAYSRFANPKCGHETCGSEERATLKACGRCANVYYCNDACAEAAWPTHRGECFVHT